MSAPPVLARAVDPKWWQGRRSGGKDRGSASIFLLGIGFVLIAVGLAGALATAAVTARHRAQVAADLGALAGARDAIQGADLACAHAGRIVAANGARLGGCRLDGLDLLVTAEVPVAGVGTATAVARAGPIRGLPGRNRRGPQDGPLRDPVGTPRYPERRASSQPGRHRAPDIAGRPAVSTACGLVSPADLAAPDAVGWEVCPRAIIRWLDFPMGR